MVKQNQGFRRDLNLKENTNDTQALSNLGGPGIANDLRIIQNNLRNISTIGFNTLSNGYFYFGNSSEFVFTNDDIVGVSTNIAVGSTTLFSGIDYYICNSNGENQFKISKTPSEVGVSTVIVTSVSPTNFNFIRKDFVNKENLLNYIPPIIQDTENFNYITNLTINRAFDYIQATNETSQYLIGQKYKGNEDTTTNLDIKFEGTITIDDPAKLNTGKAGIDNPKSPGVFIGDTRAFSSSNNPWIEDGNTLKTLSSEVSIGELYFSNEVAITGISTETGTNVAVTSFTHKLPVIINGETYYLLLST
jgi:hypothetical protein